MFNFLIAIEAPQLNAFFFNRLFIKKIRTKTKSGKTTILICFKLSTRAGGYTVQPIRGKAKRKDYSKLEYSATGIVFKY